MASEVPAFELRAGDVIPHEGHSATVLSVSAPKPHGLGKMHFVDILLDVDGAEVWYSPEANTSVEREESA